MIGLLFSAVNTRLDTIIDFVANVVDELLMVLIKGISEVISTLW